jgi:hypothetical protein
VCGLAEGCVGWSVLLENSFVLRGELLGALVPKKVVKNQMEIKNKLVAFSILAVIIGIASVVPLAFFMSPAQAQTTDNIPWFNLDVPYASWTATSQDNATGYLVGIGPIYGLVSYNSTYYVALNFTVNPDAVDILDNARVEYYQLQVYSDKGQIDNVTTSFGANCKDDVDPTSSFFFAREDWFNTTTSGGGGTFITKFNGTLTDCLANGLGLGGLSGSSSSNSFANTTLPEEFLNIQNANRIYIDVRRLGYVTFNGNSTIVTLASNEVIQHIELTKSGDQFVYGTLPQNLSQVPTIPFPQIPVIPEQLP